MDRRTVVQSVTALVVLMFAAPVWSTAHAAAWPELANPGFEESRYIKQGTGDSTSAGAHIVGDLATGWNDNSGWADVDIEYALDRVNPHRGKSAQRVTVRRVSSGAVQYVQNMTFEKSRAYSFRVWMRGQPGRRIHLSLRRAGAPYTEYMSRTVALAAEWQEFRLDGLAKEDADGFVMIRTTEPQTFFIDDASLVDLSELLANIPPREGNLVNGGSFEAGVSFGWSVRIEGDPGVIFADRRPTSDYSQAHAGERSLRVDVLKGGHAQIQSPILALTGERKHAASFWIRASRPNTEIWAVLRETDISAGARVGTSWQRVILRGRLPFLAATWLVVNCRAREDVTLWIDGVLIEERSQPSAEYEQSTPHDLVLSLDRPGHVVFDRERESLGVSIAPPAPARSRVRFTCVDILGGEHRVRDLRLPAETLRLPEFRECRRGLFKLRGVVVDAAGDEISAPSELIWSRLPRPREIDDPMDSFMGVHIPFSQDFASIARAVGTRWVRTHDTSMIGKWPIAEPERGRWEFYDDAVDVVTGSGLAVLGMLDGAPPRVATKPRKGGYWGIWNLPDAPGAMAEWETYVRTVAGHYRGRIDHWEIWNEPYGEWWVGNGGSPELYGRISRAAYRVAKAANPAAFIVGIDTYRGSTWTEEALAAVGTDHMDAFSFHDYNDVFYGGPDPAPMAAAQHFGEILKKHGKARPLWNTEGGLFAVGSWYAPATGGLTAREQVAYIVRFDVTYMAAGVKNFFLYGIHSDPAMGQTSCRATEHDRAIKPVLAARAVLAWLVDGVGRPVRSEPAPGIDAYEFPSERGRGVTVMWTYDGQAHTTDVPREAEVLDVMGNPVAPRRGEIELTHEPVYVRIRR